MESLGGIYQDSSAIKSWPYKVDLKEIQLGVNQTQNVYITSWRSKLLDFYGWKLIDDEDLNCKIFTERLRYCICIFRYHIFLFSTSHTPPVHSFRSLSLLFDRISIKKSNLHHQKRTTSLNSSTKPPLPSPSIQPTTAPKPKHEERRGNTSHKASIIIMAAEGSRHPESAAWMDWFVSSETADSFFNLLEKRDCQPESMLCKLLLLQIASWECLFWSMRLWKFSRVGKFRPFCW